MYKIILFFTKLFFLLIVFQLSVSGQIRIDPVPFEGNTKGFHNNSFNFTASWYSKWDNADRQNSLLWIFGDGNFGFSTIHEPITHTYHQKLTLLPQSPYHKPYALVTQLKDDDENPLVISSNTNPISNLTPDQFTSDRENLPVKMEDNINNSMNGGSLRLIANRSPKPGDDVTFVITYKNTCDSEVTVGSIIFEFDDTIFEPTLTFDYNHFYYGETDHRGATALIGCAQSPLNNRCLEWNFGNMLSGEQRNIILTLKTKPTARIGQEVNCSLRLGPLLNSEGFLVTGCINTKPVSLSQTITNSHDPNFKVVTNEEPLCRSEGYNNELQEYYIEFQNIGGAAADTVRVIDQLHEYLDWNSIEFEYTDEFTKFPNELCPSMTSPPKPDTTGRIEWIFKGDGFLRGMREPGYGVDFHPDDTKGWIKFKARPVKMPLCGAIPNRAEIIFDCNPSIFTTTSLNKIDCWDCLGSCKETKVFLDTLIINQGQMDSVTLSEITPTLSNPDFIYEWYPKEFVANTNQPNTTFKPNVTTNYILIAYDASTLCERYLFHKTVVVRPCLDLNLLEVQQICDENDKGNIKAEAMNGTPPYTWSTCETATSISMNNLKEGVYHIYVKDSKGCSADTLIHIDAPLPLWVDLEQNGNQVETLVSGGFPSYQNYHWSTGAMGTTNTSIPVSLSGIYTVTVTDAKGCTATQSIETIAKKSGLVDIENGISPLILYPNPTSQAVRLDFAVAQKGTYQLKVVDVYGQVHQTQYFPLQEGHHTQALDLTDVEEGVYWIVLYHQGVTQTKKIVVIH